MDVLEFLGSLFVLNVENLLLDFQIPGDVLGLDVLVPELLVERQHVDGPEILEEDFHSELAEGVPLADASRLACELFDGVESIVDANIAVFGLFELALGDFIQRESHSAKFDIGLNFVTVEQLDPDQLVFQSGHELALVQLSLERTEARFEVGLFGMHAHDFERGGRPEGLHS